MVPDALIRLVRMTIQVDDVETFLILFDQSSAKIRAFDGCLHLELWQDANQSNVFTTYSHWTDREALDAYRRSELFVATWTEVKALFAARPEAHSFTRIRRL
jgi:quinol monooxygenase YgiN